MPNAPRRDRYHHGNIAEAAIAAALDLVEQDEGSGFSLRAVANRIGVAHRAVASHFGDKAGLEAALSAQGFDWLSDRMETVGAPAEFISEYARFALDHPALYDLMMRQGYDAFERHPVLRVAADRIIALALTKLAEPIADATARRRMVMRLWMLSHGGIALHRAGVLRGRNDDDFVAELLAIAGLGPAPIDILQPLWRELKEQTDEG